MDFSNYLIYWYLKNKRDLPWRKTKNPYFIWLSEIILQQTKIAQGKAYYLKFIDTFPTIFDLANSDEDTVLKLWQGLGYYTRARNLHQTAKYIVNYYDGNIPTTYDNLIKLKGIGDYTAAAISSICFNEPRAVVDGNVYRVLSRYYNIFTPINTSKGVREFKKLAQSLINVNNPGDHNQAIMELGALICTPRNTTCNECPLNKGCSAFKSKNILELPVKEKKIKIRKRFFNFLVIDTEDSTLLEKRNKKDIWQNLYQFPVYESNSKIGPDVLIKSNYFNTIISNNEYKIHQFNQKPIIHKLSHQHIYTFFWIIKTDKPLKNAIKWENVTALAVPTLIHNFIHNYKK